MFFYYYKDTNKIQIKLSERIILPVWVKIGKKLWDFICRISKGIVGIVYDDYYNNKPHFAFFGLFIVLGYIINSKSTT